VPRHRPNFDFRRNKNVRATLIKAALFAAAASMLLACGGGDPMAKAFQHQEAMLKILEDNKDDTDKAVTALEAYMEKNKAALEALQKEGAEFQASLQKMFKEDPVKAAELIAKHAPRTEALAKRQAALAESNPELMAHEKVRAAFARPR